VRAVSHQEFGASRLGDDPVQVVDSHPRCPHHGNGGGIIALHIVLEAIKVGATAGVPVVEDGGGSGEQQRSSRFGAQAPDDLRQVRRIGVEWYLVLPAVPRALEIVQATIEVDKLRLLLHHPRDQMLQHIATVTAVGRWRQHDGLPGETVDDKGGVAQADGVTHQHHFRRHAR